MPSRCMVPGCKGNYDSGPRVRVYSFPSDEHLKKKWLKAIPRSNFNVSKASKVCELHFKDEDIEMETSTYDPVSGKKISASLSRSRLKKGCVPSLFPGCPAYLSCQKQNRESPNDKKVRLQNEHLHLAVQQSIQSKAEEDAKYMFSTYEDFLICLETQKISSFWSVIRKEGETLFAHIDIQAAPVIKASVVVKNDLSASAFIGNAPIKSCKGDNFPVKIKDIRNLQIILEFVQSLLLCDSQTAIASILATILDLLEGLKSNFQDEETIVNFLIEQVSLLSCNKVKRYYAPETLIFSTLLHSISPHAYKFLRHSGNIILPHAVTIRKISTQFNTSPYDEQFEVSFLRYASEKFMELQPHERIVSLMMGEIHIKPYLDYKGGNIVGSSFNTKDAATSAHVFMIQSLLSQYKDVVHILPVKAITADVLHSVIKKIIVGLENIGFFIICVVSDNNSINRKAMCHFANPPKLSIVYPHPAKTDRPLFYVIDSVHILKCIRNNWLNQKNLNQCLYYPNFETFEKNIEMKTASFHILKKLHETEKNNLVTFNRTLTFKSLNPSNLERQSVKLVLQIFNEHVINALLELGEKNNLQFAKETANFIKVIHLWWCIVNVKSPHKGIRLKNEAMKPLTAMPDDENVKFLNMFLNWLDTWKSVGCTAGSFTKETHLALTHTTHALLEMKQYCIHELKMTYFLCGKVETDSLEERFGKYRFLAGSQYHVSVRQIFECESKLRLQNSFSLRSAAFGQIAIDEFNVMPSWENMDEEIYSGNIDVTNADISAVENVMPILTYLAGYCVHTVCKRQKCLSCKSQFSIDKELICEDSYRLISNIDRGCLKYPHPDIVNIVMYCYIVVLKLLSAEYEHEFLKVKNQRNFVVSVAFSIINRLIQLICVKQGMLLKTVLKKFCGHA